MLFKDVGKCGLSLMKPLPLHVNLLMMSGAPVFVILICVFLFIQDSKFYIKKKISLLRQNTEKIRSTHFYGRYEVVVQIILESIGKSLKICEICEEYQLLDEYDIKRIKGVSVCDHPYIRNSLYFCTIFHEMVVIKACWVHSHPPFWLKGKLKFKSIQC